MKFSKIAIIAKDADLAEKVSIHFRKSGVYLPLFEAPVNNLEKYGFFNNDCIRISNAISALKSLYVVFLKCETDVINALKTYLPSVKFIELNEFDEAILSRLPGYKKVSNYKQKDLTPVDNVKGHIIAVEESNDPENLSRVIARNLASLDSASVTVIPGATREEVEDAHEYLRLWASGSNALDREKGKDAIFGIIKKRLIGLITSNTESISFITRGIPYGIYPFSCPTTHYFSIRSLGLNVIRGMMKSSYKYLRCPIVYLCDPGELPESEFEALRETFHSRGYIVRNSFGKNAKVRDAAYVTEHLPLDFIFYSTHCGELKGRRIKERFRTPDGQEHLIVYDLAAGFAPKPGSELIQVMEFKRWVSLDGVDWSDREGKNKINVGYIMDEYVELSRKVESRRESITVVETSDADFIKSSDALKMYDSNFIPALHDVGGNMYPIVFNNACSSWKELAIRFSCAGASIYVGTSLDIPNLVATNVAKDVGGYLANGRAVGHSLQRAQKTFITDFGYTPYLMHGYIFTKCFPIEPRQKNSRIVVKEFKKIIEQWKRYSVNTPVDELKRNSEEIAQFLEDELKTFLE